jgi:hypothetical protein
MKRILISAISMLFAGTLAATASDMRLPEKATAGQRITIATSGNGSATLYVVGPGVALKRAVRLGEEIQIKPEELRKSGFYQIVLKSADGDVTKELFVAPGPADKINFLARPSRVPVGQPKVIAGTAFVFDQYENLVTTPTPVTFNLSVAGAPAKVERTVAHDGVAFSEAGSGSKAGAAQFVASAGDASVRRVVEEVASDPCNLRFTIHREKEGLVAQTDTVRDCSGNPVPDGTIVTFISKEPGKGRSTVDARIRKGIARAILPAVPGATISVASGVVLGNEVRWGGGE